ncbi:MAG TPA: Ig-like domain-containing protein, partial [Actinomycetota bacterium]
PTANLSTSLASPPPPPPNHNPTAVNDFATTRSATAVGGNVLANDGGIGDTPIQVSKTSNPGAGTAIVHHSGTWTFTPEPLAVGVDTFSYKVCDAQGECDTAIVSITVLPDDMPVAVADAAATPPATPVSGNVLSNDTGLSDTPITVTMGSPATNGSVVIDPNGDWTYTPTVNGIDSFGYNVCDFDGDCDSGTVTVSVG